MNLLLDSHVLLWWLDDDPTLTSPARAAIADPENLVAVSAATVWEASVKRASGKLEAPSNLVERLRADGFEPLSITVEHAARAGRLPRHHDDPFDRMLVAQAKLERLTLVTRDPRFAAYGVDSLAA